MTHLSKNGVYLTENLEEPQKRKRHDFGLIKHGRDAVKTAETTLGVMAKHMDAKMDTGTRASGASPRRC